MRRYYRRRRSYSNNIGGIVMALLLAFCFGSAVIMAIFNFLANNIWFVVLVVAISAIAFGGYVICKHINKKCNNFIFEHSVAIKKLKAINSHYQFEEVPCLDMQSSYDNENFYIDISPLDYLTYQLVDQKREVLRAIGVAERNAEIFADYLKVVGEIQEFDKYDTDILPFFEKIRKSKEKKMFDGMVLKPITDLKIKVAINLTNVNGVNRDRKYNYFDSNEIKRVIERLSRKNGIFFTDEEVWRSICRVERGKVTNKVRFAVYNRDGNRCRRCGSPCDLEVDHIYPISKGGKSNFNNLQTLCHTCNALKSNKVEYGAANQNAYYRGQGHTCARCGAPLVLRKGKNGEFYGCSNYPKCKYTQKI
jgi:5-methylcytosine-specific restriction endonuclease McrA